MAISYALLKPLLQLMLEGVLKGPPDHVADTFSDHDRQLVVHTAITCLLPLAGIVGRREGMTFEEVIADFSLPGINTEQALQMITKLSEPLLQRTKTLEAQHAAVESFKRNPSDDAANTLFKSMTSAIKGAFEVLEELPDEAIPKIHRDSVTAGIVSLSGAIIHAIHMEAGASEDALYELFEIPKEHIPKMKQASASTQTLVSAMASMNEKT